MARRIRISARRASEGTPDVASIAPIGFALKGLTEPETAILKLIGATNPGGKSILSKRIAAFLDGKTDVIEGAPELTKKFSDALDALRNQPK